MNMIEIIEKKKNKGILSSDEIKFFVKGVTNKSIPDYQTSALLMAICINGMNYEETYELTMAMADSGDRLKPSKSGETILDKHSTGGVGDKTTLIVGPVMASLGVKVAKMSGRGLGITGGTVDKLESIPGFDSNLSEDRFKEVLNTVGFVDAAQTRDLAPADKILYSLRDVTATVESIPLISSSIMSKKIASGADAIVLDVKCGSGAFMKDSSRADKLAQTMISIGQLAGRKCTAVISDMEMPLGKCVGNLLEVQEAVRFLKGIDRDERLYELVITLCTQMYMLSDEYNGSIDSEQVKKLVSDILDTDKPYKKFIEFVNMQGGDTEFVSKLYENPGFISDEPGEICYEFTSDSEGIIAGINAELIGKTAMALGAGRKTLEDEIDNLAGVVLTKKYGDSVKKGEVLARLYSKNEELINNALIFIKDAYTILVKNEYKELPIVKSIVNSFD